LAGAKAVKMIRRPGSDRPWTWSLKNAVVDEDWDARAVIDYARTRAVPWTVEYHARLLIEHDPPTPDALESELLRRGE
jgi:hypothetical protein